MSKAVLGQFKGVLLAMAGRTADARELLRASDATFNGHPGGGANRPAYHEPVAQAWQLLGEPTRAENELIAKYRHYRSTGLTVDAQALQPAYRLALLYCDQERRDEAERWIEYGRDLAVPDDFREWAVLGLAARARVTGVVELGRQAVDLAELSDSTNLRGLAWLALADVQRRGGETAEAEAATDAALRLYRAKGNKAAELAVLRKRDA
jgi:hypothetical protein